MGSLTYRRRKNLAKNHPEVFAVRPSKDNPLGGYPLDTAGRARSALARASASGDAALEKKVRAKVRRMFPRIHEEGMRRLHA